MAVDPDPVSGERRRLSRTVHGTRSEAKDALQRMVVDAGGGLYGGGRVTLGDLPDQFLASATLGPTTRADWVSVTERHLKPALGDMPLWKLTSRDCDQLYARMKAAGLGQSRVRCAHVVLHRAVAQAVRWGCLVRNPVSNATRPPVARVTISPPGIDDVRAALAASRKADIELWCWLQVAIASGAPSRANRLGHARTSTTLDIYWGFVPAHDRGRGGSPRRRARTGQLDRTVSRTGTVGIGSAVVVDDVIGSGANGKLVRLPPRRRV